MMKNKKEKPKRTCGDCIHESSCGLWNCEYITDMDATNCKEFETVKDSVSYFCGFRDGQKSNCNQYAIDRLHELIGTLEGERNERQ